MWAGVASNSEEFQSAAEAGQIDAESLAFFNALISAIENDELVWATWLADPNTANALALWSTDYPSNKVVDFISLDGEAGQMGTLFPFNPTPAFYFIDEDLKFVALKAKPHPDLIDIGWVTP